MHVDYKKVVIIDVRLEPEDLVSLTGSKDLYKSFDMCNLGQEYHGQEVCFEVRVHLESQVGRDY